MPHRHAIFVAAAVLLVLTYALPARGQGRPGRGSPAARPSPTPRQAKAAQAAESDSFWAAQRSIEAAIQQLEAYLKHYPDGERAATAHRQVEALRGMSVSATTAEWVRMGESYLRETPEWRVASVEPQQDRARVTVEVACRRIDGGDCSFLAFDHAPLVLIDDAGRHYPMLESARLPADVRLREGSKAVISGGRVVAVVVDFAPLWAGAVSGQVYYRDDNRAQPARFSLGGRR